MENWTIAINRNNSHIDASNLKKEKSGQIVKVVRLNQRPRKCDLEQPCVAKLGLKKRDYLKAESGRLLHPKSETESYISPTNLVPMSTNLDDRNNQTNENFSWFRISPTLTRPTRTPKDRKLNGLPDIHQKYQAALNAVKSRASKSSQNSNRKILAVMAY